jgi:PAS domain S-box-containing protein
MKSKSGTLKNIFLGINSIAGNSWQIASFLDISSVRQTEKALQQSEQQFQNLIRNIPGIVYLCYYDEHWTMHYLVKEIENISGYPASDFINNNVRSYASIVHPDDVEIVTEAIRKGVEANKPYEMEYRIIKKNGEIAWVYEKGQKVCTENENVWLNGIIFDITERKQLQLALDIATEEWRVTFDALPDAILLANRECSIVKCNKASEKLFGLSKDKIIGQRCFELIYGLDQPPKDSPYLKMLKSGRATSKIEYFDKKIVKITASPVINPDGNIYGTVLLISDVTKLRKTAEKIKNKHKLLKSVFHTAPIGIGVIADRKLIQVNEEFCRITGYNPEELIGRDVIMFHDTRAEYDRVATYYEGLKKNKVATVNTKLKRKNGEMFEAMLRFSILETDINGYTYTLTDITTEKFMLKQ